MPNIFHVLNKDDKELIHSAMLKYLFETDPTYIISLLGVENPEDYFIDLEKRYSIPNDQEGNKNVRFDLQMINMEEQKIIVIENKFKCFPYKEQLKDYSSALVLHYKDFEHKKFVFCFDNTPTGSLPNDWIVITYQQILQEISTRVGQLTGDDEVFVRHYHEILAHYYNEYHAILGNPATLHHMFLNHNEENNKFYLKLFFSHVMLELDNLAQIEKTWLNTGSTAVPLINIHPTGWDKLTDDHEYLIQFQGREVKFYAHLKDGIGHGKITDMVLKLRGAGFVEFEQNSFKKLTSREPKSMYIYKTTITDHIAPVDFSKENIVTYLTDFYNRINTAVF